VMLRQRRLRRRDLALHHRRTWLLRSASKSAINIKAESGIVIEI
jgi:hypothetical protein